MPLALSSDDVTTRIPDGIDQSAISETMQEEGNTEKLWDDLEFIPDKPNCKTWEEFNDGQTVAHRPMFISEAGSSAYDSLLQETVDYLQLGNSDIALVNQQAYFSCLLHVALAQESELFKKDDQSVEFASTLANIRIPGYSRQVLSDVEKECAACGKVAMDLALFSKQLYSQQPSHCAVAFASAINQVLEAVRKHAVIDAPAPRSILNLQNTIRNMFAILRPLEILSREMNGSSTDEEVLTILFNYASLSDNSDTYTRDVSREMLQIVSQTWIEFIEEWIGTRPERGIPLTLKDIGAAKGFVKVDMESFTDDFGREVQSVDFAIVEASVPEFMPADVATCVFQTGRNLRFIKTFHPSHVLAQDGIMAKLTPPKASWLYNWSNILQLETEMAAYRDRVAAAIASVSRDGMIHEVPPTSRYEPVALEFFGYSDTELEARLQASIHALNKPPQYQEQNDAFSEIIQKRLQEETASVVTAGQEPHWSLVPALSFGSIALIQAQLVGRASLKLLFDKHDLHMHLNLQHQFQLLGNGIFCSRLSHALFDPDLETTERRAGVAREGGVMGLRLGGRDTWPPASSELRLALMGVLKESCDSVAATGTSRYVRGQQELPGDLSFAIRDLPEEDIQRCKDVDSLEALDFLRLSYTTPPELSAIFTPMVLVQYDRIFKLLLRVLRMLYTVNMISRDINFGWGRFSYVDDVRYRFVREANHIVTCISAYFLDSGVSIPWKKFEQGLKKIRSDLDIPFAQQGAMSDVTGPQQVHELQEIMLQQITQNLFLRKRQQPILELLEGMFSCILRYAKYTRLEELRRHKEILELEEPTAIYNDFKKHVQMFLIVCRELSEKAKLSTGGKDRDMAQDSADAGLLLQLLAKLDLFDYYAN